MSSRTSKNTFSAFSILVGATVYCAIYYAESVKYLNDLARNPCFDCGAYTLRQQARQICCDASYDAYQTACEHSKTDDECANIRKGNYEEAQQNLQWSRPGCFISGGLVLLILIAAFLKKFGCSACKSIFACLFWPCLAFMGWLRSRRQRTEVEVEDHLIRESSFSIGPELPPAEPIVRRQISSADNCCAICMEVLTEGTVKVLRCGHGFHQKCIADWFEPKAPQARNCPYCRELHRSIMMST